MALPPHKPGIKGPGNPLQIQRAKEEAEGQDRHRTEALADACSKLEEDLEALKARFEMYFLGIERREPAREREEMKRRVARLKGEFTRNTGLRFRIETLHARFLSYERMWNRSVREREEGTYRLDLVKARRRAKAEDVRQGEKARRRQKGEQEPSGAEGAEPVSSAEPPSSPAQGAAIPHAAPAHHTSPDVVPPTPKQPSPDPVVPHRHVTNSPRAQPSLPPGFTEETVRELFSSYVDAKKQCKEDFSKLTYETVARTVAKQVPELMAKFKARAVEFRVVIKDGRAVMKAIPKV